MYQPGALLFQRLRIYQIYGANTDVGKTIFSTILCRAATSLFDKYRVYYVKPVSTGPVKEADDRHLSRYAPEVSVTSLFQYDAPVSPHLAARGSLRKPRDSELLAAIHAVSRKSAADHAGWLFLETAGGVHSPGPSGTSQADLYRPLRLPVVLVGDSRLGGISQTISAFESLRMRGYDVETVLLFENNRYQNHEYLAPYFGDKYSIPVFTTQQPPEDRGYHATNSYYAETSSSTPVTNALKYLHVKHHGRLHRLKSMDKEALEKIWYPFTQHKGLQPKDITVIDSAWRNDFQAVAPAPSQPVEAERPRKRTELPDTQENMLRPSFDGSASWWTQGLGHGNPALTMAAAYAAGRYGHVIFPEAVHEPALRLATTLLERMGNPRLKRAFFSDNGSTGIEVAIKMALRAASIRYGWVKEEEVGVLGLKGSYHGDTMGAMDCSEPGGFNAKVEWHVGRGFWFDYPTVLCRRGQWFVQNPGTLGGSESEFASLDEVFDIKTRKKRPEADSIRSFIQNTLDTLDKQGRFGALILEPVVLGAGGMLLVDPLFQHLLVEMVRQRGRGPVGSSTEWSGMPVVFDEVFTGLYRLGRFSAASFLGVNPDISVHAKLLTGGLVPLSVTLASESIFEAFSSDHKADALLHGHSYTAHPVGCQVALASIGEMVKMKWQERPGDCVWNAERISKVSNPKVSGAWGMGSVLAVHMTEAADGEKANSMIVRALLREGREVTKDSEPFESWNVHSRVLGNVIYLMAGQRTTASEARKVEDLLCEILRRTFWRTVG